MLMWYKITKAKQVSSLFHLLTTNPSNKEMSVMAETTLTKTCTKHKSKKQKKPFSAEHRRKLSEAAKKRWEDSEYRKEMAAIVMTDEGKKSVSDSMKAKWKDPVYRDDHTGHERSKETKQKIAEKAKERWADPEYKAWVAKKIGKTAKEVWERPGYKEKMSKALKGIQAGEKNHMWGKKISEERRKNLSEAHKGIQAGENHPMYGQKHSEESRKKMSDAHKGNALSEENKRNIAKANKKVWANLSEEKRDEWIRNNRASQRCSPTKPESTIFSILNDLYPNEWKFVGDGAVVIAGKNPDFINVNGKKQLVECFGDYWHKGEDPQDRINVFKPYGYDTLVIWESELKEIDLVIKKIQNFAEAPNG